MAEDFPPNAEHIRKPEKPCYPWTIALILFSDRRLRPKGGRKGGNGSEESLD